MDEKLDAKARKKEAIAAEQAAAASQRTSLLKNNSRGVEAQVSTAPTGRVTVAATTSEERVSAPVRGPCNPMQAALSSHLGAASFASFVSFDATTASGDAGNSEKTSEKKGPQRPAAMEPAKSTAPSVAATAKALDAEVSPPAVELESDSDLDKDMEVGAVDAEGAAEAKVKRFLNRMRGTNPVGKQKKEKEKEKKEKPPKPPATGPLEGKEQIKQKKDKKEKEKKDEKKKRKKDKKTEQEEDRQRAKVAAERDTKRIFGRDTLVIGSSSEDSE